MIQTQHSFYMLSEIFISLIGGGLLLAIWSAIQKNFKQKLAHEISVKRIDKGLLYLSFSLFIWAISGIVSYLNMAYLNNDWLALVSRNVFSIANSLFLILALFYLDNSPQYLYNNKKSTRKIILFLVGLSVFSFLLSIKFGDTINTFGIRYSAIPDLILSATLLWFLGFSLFKTFVNRDMVLVAIISVITIGLLFISQLFEVFHLKDFLFYDDLIKIISKTALLSLFLVLGTSWVIELSQLPTATEMKIHYTDWNQVQISIPSKGIDNKKINFGKKTTQFNNLLKFGIRRKFAPENEMCIEVYNGGEILSQTYVSRIVDNINDILVLENENKLQRNDLFTFIGQGKYRLRFLPNFIEIDSALLNEFVHNTENEQYKAFV
ncbi:MAG: hypothetical protein V3U80_06735 [Flavobacteriaceae bacterium]